MKSIFPFAIVLMLIGAGIRADALENREQHRIRYLMRLGRMNDSLTQYQNFFQKHGKHDNQLLSDVAQAILEEGIHSNDLESQVLSIFGAGISMDDNALPILVEGLHHSNPMIQLVSLNFLAKHQSDEADEAIHRALSSNSILIRLEAIVHLAEKKSPVTVGQLETIIHKLDPKLLSLFPRLFAMEGSPAAIQNLHRLMVHPREEVRIEAILSAAKYGRDDLLPEIRKLAKHHQPAQQEACAAALGAFKDRGSETMLLSLTSSPTASVRLAAFYALYEIGLKNAADNIRQMAEQQDLFAISLLGKIQGSEPVLRPLVKSENNSVRINAALSLLELGDPGCVSVLGEILIRDSRDYAFVQTQSIGKGLSAIKVIPSARHNLENLPAAYELSLSLRESALAKTIELDEGLFFLIADEILESRQRELVPTLIQLIENHSSEKAIALLKKHQQKIGAPLIRNYCNLALYRLKQPGPYLDNLTNWIDSAKEEELIRFRPVLQRGSDDNSPYQLNPEESTRLLVECFETLAKLQNEDGINILLNAIQYGNSTNKYALAGLLMRAVQ